MTLCDITYCVNQVHFLKIDIGIDAQNNKGHSDVPKVNIESERIFITLNKFNKNKNNKRDINDE